jgi:hypothetical protein
MVLGGGPFRDLVDVGEGQDEARLLRTLQVFSDIRGNHDMYNVPLRGGADDSYAVYGWSTPALKTSRIVVHDIKGATGACPGTALCQGQQGGCWDVHTWHMPVA